MIAPVIGVAQSVNFIDVQGLTKPIKDNYVYICFTASSLI